MPINSNKKVPFPLLIALVVCVVILVVAAIEAEKEQQAKEEKALVEWAVVVMLVVKRAMDWSNLVNSDKEGGQKIEPIFPGSKTLHPEKLLGTYSNYCLTLKCSNKYFVSPVP